MSYISSVQREYTGIQLPLHDVAVPRRVHVVDPSPFIRFALREELSRRAADIPVGVLSGRWLAMHDWGYGPDVVVLRAAMRDVWPVVVKVRALQRLSCRTIVLAPPAAPSALVRRVLSDGAAAVLPTDCRFEDLVDATVREARHPRAPLTQPPAAPDLTDREVQIGNLFASPRGYTTAQIGEVLGLSPNTVRAQLDSCRRRFRDRGEDVSDRARLRAALTDAGYTAGAAGWLV